MKPSTLFHALFSFLLLITDITKAEMSIYDVFEDISDMWGCPDPADFVKAYPLYDIECVENSIPPWPLCLFHNITYFVAASVSSASRCCDFENLDECRCPLKNHDKFQKKMKEWCPKIIENCPQMEIDSMISSEMWVSPEMMYGEESE